MYTKLSRYCDGIMEAAWLAAVVVVPVFFNVYSSRIFEPDKIALLRSLALLLLAAWGVKLIETGRQQWAALGERGRPFKVVMQTPMVIPALLTAGIYLLSTLFSVTPSVSFWGSYQRLQGTYTTLAYLVVFAVILGNMRQRAQVERLITTIILASLPVALYGVLQHYRLDTIPWGGDTSTRIAANLGNSIFVAAYLIIVFPLTISRIIESFGRILKQGSDLLRPMLLGTIYVFIAALQMVALYFSGSRGPALGWMASMFVFILLMSLYWRKRWMTIGMVGMAVLLAGVLFLLNLESGPLQSLRSSPAIGRFGNLLNAESSSALVRRYIWEGVADLVSPHEPLEYPDGTQDGMNWLRPVIGYGPESMYVVYNKFYVPALAQVERRNASPDRAHNETWDSLAITGLLGLLVYLSVFASAFYYGFKWLGLITSQKRKYLFLGLYVGGGVLGAIIFGLWRGIEYIGVGLPFGILLGLIAFVVIVSLFLNFEPPKNEGQSLRFIILLALTTAILAYFVESNFGISIAVTRTYFWIFSAALVVVGLFLPRLGEYGAEIQELESTRTPAAPGLPDKSSTGTSPSKTVGDSSKKKRQGERRGGSTAAQRGQPAIREWVWEALAAGCVAGFILVTLGFNHIANSQNSSSAVGVFVASTTGKYFAVFFMILTTWVMASLALAASCALKPPGISPGLGLLRQFLVVFGLSGGLAVIYWLWHSGGLAYIASVQIGSNEEILSQVIRYENILTRYYIYLFALVFLAAAILPLSKSSSMVERLPISWRDSEKLSRHPATVIIFTLLLAGVFYLVSLTNLRIIQADTAFKIADSFARPNSWELATNIYNHAIDQSPNEDFYYLFLGRAQLEAGKAITDPLVQEQFISQAEADLREAQGINPLNTDHTANLARLYSMWASATPDAELRAERARKAGDYFARAVTLSPNNARLWAEWALNDLNHLDKDSAVQRLQQAIEIDPNYDWTYGLLGEILLRDAQSAQEPAKQTELLTRAAGYYEQALENINPYDAQNRLSYILSLGGIYALLSEPQQAIRVYQSGLPYSTSDLEKARIEEAIAQQFQAAGDIENALIHLNNALIITPEDQRQRIQDLINQLNGSP